MRKKRKEQIIICLFIVCLYGIIRFWVQPALLHNQYKNVNKEQKPSVHDTIGITYNRRENLYTLNSPGGYSDVYYAKALEIRSNNAAVHVWGVCMSACSEYLLMVAAKIKLINMPMIGFHGNPLTNDSLANSIAPDVEHQCITTTRDKFGALQHSSGVPNTFNSYQIKMIGVEKLEPTEVIQGCPTASIKFKNYMWLATSQQLRSQMNLKFTGGTCADNFDKCAKRVDRRWDKGSKIVIGEKIYISKGRNK